MPATNLQSLTDPLEGLTTCGSWRPKQLPIPLPHGRGSMARVAFSPNLTWVILGITVFEIGSAS